MSDNPVLSGIGFFQSSTLPCHSRSFAAPSLEATRPMRCVSPAGTLAECCARGRKRAGQGARPQVKLALIYSCSRHILDPNWPGLIFR